MSDDTAFRFLLRVRYAECDAQGIVFNARYGDYVDVAATEFIRAVWGGYHILRERGLDYHVVSYRVDWTSPARFDDVLDCMVETVRIGTTSFTLRTTFREWRTGRPIAAAETTHVMIHTGNGAKIPIPDDFRTRLETGAPGVIVDHAGAVSGTDILPPGF